MLDASAVLKGIGDEDHTSAFRHWLMEAHAAGADLLAPHLLRFEVGQFLARASPLSAALRQQAQDRLLHGIRFADGSGLHDLAPPLTYYDASYAALARSARAALVTYDERLSKAARRWGIPVVTPA